jgi:hypothetical protein
MKRRTLKMVRPDKPPEHHHNFYAVRIDPAVIRIHYEEVVHDNQRH